MIIWMLSALIMAFVVSFVFGQQYIPWLKKHGFVQPIKDEVGQIIYNADDTSNDNN